ncbi:hypothetical protein IR073_06635 [Gemella sp. 19428wG2_WT2a]|nr:hypothetical protein [Gemella sp. 19428wG2_WT2a]TFU57711.1 hypothetical protein E4T67_06560 [Gemella sp. WT2a]
MLSIQRQEMILKVIEYQLNSTLKDIYVKLNLILDLNGKLIKATTFKNYKSDLKTVSEIMSDNHLKRYVYSSVYLPSYAELNLPEFHSLFLARTYSFDKNIFKEKLLELISLETSFQLDMKSKQDYNYLYNLEYLETNTELDIYKLSDKDVFRIVSIDVQEELL